MYKLITHNDLDGVGCAILAQAVFGRSGIDITYCGNPTEATEVLGELHADLYDTIYVTDISFNPDEIRQSTLKKIRLFDHHATALGLREYGQVAVHIGNHATCGTELFFKYLSALSVPLRKFEWFVEQIRQYDTWEWNKEISHLMCAPYLFNSLLHLYGREKFVDFYFNFPPTDFDTAFDALDIHLVEYEDLRAENELKDAMDNIHFVHLHNYLVGLVFGNYNFSLLGNKICERYNVDFAMQINLNTRTIQVRSTSLYLDLGKIMKDHYMGGGHSKAAGGQLSRGDWRNVIDDCFEALGFVVDVKKVGDEK